MSVWFWLVFLQLQLNGVESARVRTEPICASTDPPVVTPNVDNRYPNSSCVFRDHVASFRHHDQPRKVAHDAESIKCRKPSGGHPDFDEIERLFVIVLSGVVVSAF